MSALVVSNTDRDALVLLDSLLDQALGFGVEDETPTVFIDGQEGYVVRPRLTPDQKKKAREFGTALAAAMIEAGITSGGGGGGGSVTLVNTGLGLTGGPISTTGTIDLLLHTGGGLSKTLGGGSDELGIAAGGVTNAMLADSSVTINTTSALSGGGTVSLGSSLTLDIAAGGVTNAMLVNDSITVNAGDGLMTGGTVVLGSSVTLAVDSTVVRLSATQELTNKTLTAMVVKNGLTATGSAANDFSGSTGAFKTSTGTNTFGGAVLLTSPTLQYITSVTAPLFNQADNTAPSGTGQPLTVQAQNATGTTSVGGNLVLTSGTGTSAPGTILFQVGGTTFMSLLSGTGLDIFSNINVVAAGGTTAFDFSAASGAFKTTTGTNTLGGAVVLNNNQLQFATSDTAPLINQADKTTNAGTGATTTLQAQNETGTTSTGGGLTLTSGTGTTAAGNLLLQTGGTTRVTVSPTTGVTVASGTAFNLPSLTTGSVPFIGASGLVTQDNGHFFWDASRARLGVGTATPGFTGGTADVPGCGFQVTNTTTHSLMLVESDAASSDAGLLFATVTLGQDAAIFLDESDNQKLKFATSNGTGGMNNHSDRTAGTRMTLTQAGRLGIGTTNPANLHDVNGNMAIGTYAGVNAAPANGLIVSGFVGVGTTSATSVQSLEVRNANASGIGGQFAIRNTLSTGQTELDIFDHNGTFRMSFGFDNNSVATNPDSYYYTASGTSFVFQTNNGGNLAAQRSDGNWTFGTYNWSGAQNTTATQHYVSIFKDVTWPGDTTSSQLALVGRTDPTKILSIGVDTNSASGFGFLQASKQGTAATTLSLQPAGGNVGLGVTNPGSRYKLTVNGDATALESIILTNTNAASYADMVWLNSSGSQTGGVGWANASTGNTLASHNFFYTPALDWLMSDGTTDFFRWYNGSSAIGFEFTAGNSATVSGSNKGKIRYNSSTQFFQSSLNTAAYVNMLQGALTATRIPFATSAGVLTDDGNLVWDNTNKSLGIGGAPSTTALHVVSAAAGDDVGSFKSTSTTGYSNIRYEDNTGVTQGSVGYANASVVLTYLRSKMHFYSASSDYVFANATSVKVTVGMTDSQTFMEFISGSSAAVSSANTGRVRYESTAQEWQVSKNAAAYERVYSGNRKDVSDLLITTTSPTTVATLTPPAQGNYIVYVYYRVVTATTTVTITLTWTDGSGAQSQTLVSALPVVVGSDVGTPVFINATAAAITVTATAGTANQLYVSADIQSV